MNEQVEQNNLPSILERTRSDVGKEVSLDTFLFACWECEKLIRSHSAPDSEESAFKKWPELASLDANEDGTSFITPARFDNLRAWLQSENPQAQLDELVDISRLVYITPCVVTMAAQTHALAIHHPNGMPPFDSKDQPTHEFWQKIKNEVTRTFPKQASLILNYFWWAFGPEPIDDIDPNSRPPVGRYTPFAKARGGAPPSSGPRPRSGGSGAGGRDQRGPRGSSHSSDRGGERGGPRGERGGPRGKRKGPPRGRDAGPPRQSPETEARLLKEVLGAVEKMNTDSSMESIVLKPHNSFHRRLQHQMVKEEGYDSHSVGDGEERAVIITRLPKQ